MNSSPPIKVSIVEDNDKIRESLAIVIDGSGGFACVSTHETAEEACKQIPLKKPDVVLMDINLAAKMSGVDGVRKLRETMPKVKILMHTVYEDREKIFESLRAGANGYLLKRTPPAKLLEALAEVHSGYAPMSGPIAGMVVEYFHQRKNESTDDLTAREKEILDHLAKGYRYKEIAEALGIGFATVSTHLHNIYEKLHVSSRTEAVVKYLGK